MPEDVGADIERLLSERKYASRTLGEYDRRSNFWKEHKQRIADADQIARGDFEMIYPDGSRRTERPKVDNDVLAKLNDASRLAALTIPSVRVDPSEDHGRAKMRAEKRENIFSHYLDVNNAEAMFPRYYMDLMLCGFTAKCVYPDFQTGFPRVERRDPRDVWPDTLYSPDRPMGSVITSCTAPLGTIRTRYEGAQAELARAVADSGHKDQINDQMEVTILEWFDSSEWIKVAMIPGSKRSSVTLQRITSRLSRIPFVIGAGPTFDGEFRGIFDQGLSVLTHRNRLANLLLDEMVNWIYAPPVSYNIENPEDFGSGAVLRATSGDGFIRRFPPAASNPQIFGLAAQLADSSRKAINLPEGRMGDAQQSIISAAGINALMGSYNTAVAFDQTTEARSWREVLSLCAEVDEKYLDGEKFISGSANARAYAITYNPSKDIKGDYACRVEYGGAAGQDPFAYEIRLLQQMDRNLIPRRTVMENLPAVKDVIKAERQIELEFIKESAKALMAQRAQQGDGSLLGLYLQHLKKGDEDPLLKVAEIAGFLPAPDSGGEAFNQAGALARGALEAPTGNVPGVGEAPQASGQTLVGTRGGVPLPPLSSILVR